MEFDAQKFEEVLGIKIKDESLFKTAVTHRSYLNEHPNYENPSNERLEFLGDAVLQLLSSQYLFENYPNEPEGQLTNYRSAIVNTSSLAQESEKLDYGQFLLLSKGEESSGGRQREYILANTYEAVLGAIYLQEGIDACGKFVEKTLFYKIDDIVRNELYKDSKSMLQETAQEKFGLTPVYKVVKSWGADHSKTFKIAVFLGDKKYGEGEGGSKQKAEQNAALDGLDNLKSI